MTELFPWVGQPTSGDGGAWNYEFFYTDHLGNSRVAFRDYLGVAKITQSNSYGAFGEDLPSISYFKAQWKKDEFRFTGQENLPETGYTDFGARLYDNIVITPFVPDCLN